MALSDIELLHAYNATFFNFQSGEVYSKDEALANISIKLGLIPNISEESRSRLISHNLFFSLFCFPAGFFLIWKTGLFAASGSIDNIKDLVILLGLGLCALWFGLQSLIVVYMLINPRTEKVERIYYRILAKGTLAEGRITKISPLGIWTTKIDYKFEVNQRRYSDSYIAQIRPSEVRMDQKVAIVHFNRKMNILL